MLEWPEDPQEIFSFAAADEELPAFLSDDSFWKSRFEALIKREGGHLHSLQFVFCSDAYLHRINLEYLQHDTLTDIITFPYQAPPLVDGEIYISLERVRENAQTYGVSFEHELQRVMAHGVLHLLGYRDKTEEEQKVMRTKEEEALALWQ